MVSNVFKTMLTGPWKEAKSKEIELPGKSLQAVVWLLDFVYPRTKLQIDGKTYYMYILQYALSKEGWMGHMKTSM